MAHVRKSIRDAVKTAVTGLTTTTSKVYVGRVYPMQEANLPGLLVYTEDEEVEIASMGVSRTQARDLNVVVEALFKDNASLDDKGDLILSEVETAMGAPGVDLGGGKYAQLRRVEIERSDAIEKLVASMRMTFLVPYYTALGAPNVAL